jgi:hypothetical protein
MGMLLIQGQPFNINFKQQAKAKLAIRQSIAAWVSAR